MTIRKSSGRISHPVKRDPLSTRGGKVPSGGEIVGLKPPPGGSKSASSANGSGTDK